MTTDRTDSLLDLLYGELSEEDEKLMREELAESAELRDELGGYEDFLGEVREAMPVEEVPSSVHASIMDAARAAVDNQDERGGRRAAPDTERQGIWRRLSGGQGSQIALVAAVLIAGVFVVKFMSPANAPSPGDIGAVQENLPAPQAAKVAEQVAEVETEASMDAPVEVVAEEPEGAEATATPQEEVDEYMPGTRRDSQREARGAADTTNVEKSLLEELGRSSEPPAPTARPEPEPEAKRKPTPRRRSRKAPSKKKAEDNLAIFGGESQNSASGVTTKSTASAQDRGFDLDDMADGEAAPKDADAAPSVAAKEDDAKAYRPPDNSLASVTQRWQNSDYNGTIREADEFLATGQGSSTDRARALELKAQSLARLGQYQAADRIYEQIERNYPGYQTAAISQARDEVQQKVRKRPKRKQKVTPQESYESMPAADSLD